MKGFWIQQEGAGTLHVSQYVEVFLQQFLAEEELLSDVFMI